MPFRLTRQADRDIREVLRSSRSMFGPAQARRYAALIDQTIALAAAEPKRLDSLYQPELGPEVRSLHLDRAAGRRGAEAHHIYYVVERGTVLEAEILVLRILHQAMDPGRRVAAALRGEKIKRS